MINEFKDEVSLWRFVKSAFGEVSEGYFLKVGKRLEGKLLVYWVMVPVGREEPSDGDRN